MDIDVIWGGGEIYIEAAKPTRLKKNILFLVCL